ncbi:MAG: NADH dehydrogenase (quinone) [Rhodobacteraceae bacterium HLUCCA12]|nr:MAG: NADH dehydrogenase (quinone) [Rhodobacteraceae bacterium HLUCCA12]
MIALATLLILPIFGALAVVAVPGQAARVAAAVAVLSGGALAVLIMAVAKGGSVQILPGGWGAPLGIALEADGLAVAFMAMTVAVTAAAIALAARTPAIGTPFWALVMLTWSALNVIYVSRDLFNMYVGLELLTLAAVALVATGGTSALAPALRYLFFALTGSLLYLAGVALIYAAHGVLDMAHLAEAPLQATDGVALALMTAGLLVKTAVFPFHAWLPPAHAAAPPPASALLSALVPKASFVILMRLWFDAVPDAATRSLLLTLAILGALAVAHGGVLALRQDRLKQIVAYSTVAQIGYLMLVFPLAGGGGAAQPWAAGAWSGAIFHALAHGLAKAAMFLCAGIWIMAAGSDRLDDLRGLARALPMTAMAFGVAAVTLMGLPPSGGFTAKYLMMTSAFASGQVVLAIVLLAGGLLAAGYLYRPMEALFARVVPDHRPVSRLLQAVPLLLALLAFAMGLFSDAVYAFLQTGRPGAAEGGL